METYGCQMNVNDSEVVRAVLSEAGYGHTDVAAEADVILLNTCAIRENAEQRIWGRLGHFKGIKRGAKMAAKSAKLARNGPRPVVGVLGCMAERLKRQILERDKSVDIVAGPDAYRDLPRLIDIARGAPGEQAINVQLSQDETYADIVPLRPAGQHSAFLSILRGCNNMCSFCIVPFTRGRERSRPMSSVLEEVRLLSAAGVREVTLLGQNVNSYCAAGSDDVSEHSTSSLDESASLLHESTTVRLPQGSSSSKMAARSPSYDDTSSSNESSPLDTGENDPFGAYASGFRSVYKPSHTRPAGATDFAELLEAVADVDPEMRVRFTSPHPKDFNDRVLEVIASRPNVCKQIHMPAQSGSSSMLERMRRGYSREAYDVLAHRAREIIPNVALSTDMITGFCGESAEEHADSVSLMREHGFETAFMFHYSNRARTHAARHLQDDVPLELKLRRLHEIQAAFRERQEERNAAEAGAMHLVLVDGMSKRNESHLTGRSDTMKRVVFPQRSVPASLADAVAAESGEAAALVNGVSSGDYVAVRVHGWSSGTLKADPVARTTLSEFAAMFGGTCAPGKVPLPSRP